MLALSGKINRTNRQASINIEDNRNGKWTGESEMTRDLAVCAMIGKRVLPFPNGIVPGGRDEKNGYWRVCSTRLWT